MLAWGFKLLSRLRKSILNEENVLKSQKGLSKTKPDTDKADTAFFANEHKDKTCHYCNKKGHIQLDCRKKKKDKDNGVDIPAQSKGKGSKNNGQNKGKGRGDKGKSTPGATPSKGALWCDHCQVSSHSTDYCRSKVAFDKAYAKGAKGASKGKYKGHGKGWSNGNFPSDYPGSFANILTMGIQPGVAHR